MNKVFLTFADSRMSRSVRRICVQAESLKFYDKILGYDESNLVPSFRKNHKDELVFGTPGYGYWCWKPQIILQALEEMNDGDILQYTDAGCHLNKGGIERLNEYFLVTAKTKKSVLAFQSKKPEPPLFYDGRELLNQPDYKWIKGDLLDYFDVRNNNNITHSETIGATIIFIKKSQESLDIIRRWHKVIEDDFSLIDNTSSISDNLDGFIGHRHDQSIFSLLCKIEGIQTISAYEYWYPSKLLMIPDWRSLQKFPIHAKRDKDLGVLKNIINFMQRVKRKILYLVSKNKS